MKVIKPYDNYKPTGIAWLGNIPEHWDMKSVRKSFLFSVGFTPPTEKNEYFTFSGNGIPWITIRDMKRKYIENSKQDISFLYKETFKRPLILKGSLLYSFKLSVGKVAFANSDMFTNEAIFSVLPNENYCLNFFFYSLPNQILKNASENIYGAKILNQALIKSAKIVFPPLPEQQKIAKFLDYKTTKIDRFIRKKKQLIKLLNEQKTGIINDAVTKGLSTNAKMKPSGIEWLGDIPKHWEVRKLKYVADCLPSNIDKHTREGEKQVRLCNYTDVYKNDFITNDMNLMLASATKDQIEKFSLKIGDVIITKDSETANDIAVPAVVKEELENVVCGYHLSVLRPYSKLVGEYLFRVLQCKPINIQFELCSNGVTRVGLGVYDMKKAQIPIPPLLEQQLIVSHIEKETTTINKMISIIEKEIALVQEYRTALIAEAVTGKIDVRDYIIPENLEEETYEELEEEISMVAEDGEAYQTIEE